MKLRPLLIFCWAQLLAVAAFVLMVGYNQAVRPALQCDYSRVTGRISDVIPGGAASRAGLRLGDRIVSINGIRVARDVSMLHFSRAGDIVPVVIERNGARETVRLVPVTTEEAREEALRSGGGRAVWAVSSYFWYPLNFWMFFLGVALLLMRAEYEDARIASLFFIYWAGGNFLADAIGIGAVLAPLPRALRLSIYITDSFFIAAFFAAAVHFALIFASDRGLPKRWRFMPYLLALPIFIEALGPDLRHLDPNVTLMEIPSSGAIYLILGPALLVLSLVILAFRLRGMSDLNGRRRLQLVFLALLPGVFGFVVANVMHLVDNYAVSQVVGLFNSGCTMAGSAIFAYAVVRHRMFNVRVLMRRGIQYAMARGTLFVAMSLPLIGLIVYLYSHRRASLAVVVTGTPAVYLLIILPLTLVISYRKRLLDALDRRFFREQYDARNLMLHVVSMVRNGSDMVGLSRVTLDEVERALHPKHVSLWRLDREGKDLVRAFVRGAAVERNVSPLPATGALVTLLSTDPDALDLHSRATAALVNRLPPAERDWLRECDAYLIGPLLIEGRLAGLMILGERMSEEPYSHEDRELLRSVAAHLALTFDYTRLKGSPSFVWSPIASRPLAPVLDELRSCPMCSRCYSADQTVCDVDQHSLTREEGIPRSIEDKYLVTRVLGRGGMGSVYLATQKRLNRPVAVKVLLAHLVGSASMRSRFEREARIVAQLNHPGIVTIHDFGVLPDGHAYLVMEYLQGQTLRKTIVAGRQTLERALEILRPVGDAVETAHRAGIVHRDLKPENIMIVSDRESGAPSPRVLDFGLAKMTGPIGDDEATILQSGPSVGILGSLMYLAPEILGGHAADARSDQYALGLIAYELLGGRHPFGNATDLASIVRGHTQDPVVPLREFAPSVPANVARAVHRALAKDADDRFDSVAEMLDAMSK
jgi:predicted Ser/Thr protein kinase